MRDHFGRRQEERASEKIANWKKSGLYPYAEAPDQSRLNVPSGRYST